MIKEKTIKAKLKELQTEWTKSSHKEMARTILNSNIKLLNWVLEK